MRPRRRGGRGIANKQYATTVESYQVQDIKPNQLYGAVFDMKFFPRSTGIGQNYKEYKINKIELKFEPLFNVFQDNSGNDTLPQMLFLMDRVGTNSPWTKQQLLSQGATPVKFTSNLVRTYKPNTIVVVQNASTNPAPSVYPVSTPSSNLPIQSAQVQFNKWISTQYDCSPYNQSGALNVSPTAWYGALFYVDQINAVGETYVGRLTVKAHISFRGPSLLAQTGVPASPGVPPTALFHN